MAFANALALWILIELKREFSHSAAAAAYTDFWKAKVRLQRGHSRMIQQVAGAN